jgi:hypothetical protein
LLRQRLSKVLSRFVPLTGPLVELLLQISRRGFAMADSRWRLAALRFGGAFSFASGPPATSARLAPTLNEVDAPEHIESVRVSQERWQRSTKAGG